MFQFRFKIPHSLSICLHCLFTAAFPLSDPTNTCCRTPKVAVLLNSFLFSLLPICVLHVSLLSCLKQLMALLSCCAFRDFKVLPGPSEGERRFVASSSGQTPEEKAGKNLFHCLHCIYWQIEVYTWQRFDPVIRKQPRKYPGNSPRAIK